MEGNNNSIDTAAIVSQLEALNQGINAENEKVDKLVEYLIVKDQQEQEEKERLQNEQLKKEEAEQVEKDSEKVNEELKTQEQETKQEETTQTYTELLTEIDEGIKLQNQLMVAQSIYIGIVVGLLFMKILFDRIFK